FQAPGDRGAQSGPNRAPGKVPTCQGGGAAESCTKREHISGCDKAGTRGKGSDAHPMWWSRDCGKTTSCVVRRLGGRMHAQGMSWLGDLIVFDAVQLEGHGQVRTDPSRDALLTDFGKATLDDRYLLPGETYQDLFARV